MLINLHVPNSKLNHYPIVYTCNNYMKNVITKNKFI